MTHAEEVGVVTEQQLFDWMSNERESENLEFKEARANYDHRKALEYVAAMANEGGGALIFGVTDARPRVAVGSQAFREGGLDSLKEKVFDKLRLRIQSTELDMEGHRVLVIEVPSRPRGQALDLDGKYLMRNGPSLVAMTFSQLTAIAAETADPWLLQDATTAMTGTEALALVDAPSFFELLAQPYPATEQEVLQRLVRHRVLSERGHEFAVSNLGALTLSRKLSAVSDDMGRRAVRFVIYDGVGKMVTKSEATLDRGYAVCFADLLGLVLAAAPNNVVLEELIRTSQPMFPEQSVREVVANAMIHQDLGVQGNRVMVEMFSDRLVVTNPGSPTIDTSRFIDDNVSRNVELAELMRRLNICEEKGSGIDKVVNLAEVHQLPAPRFTADGHRTEVTLFAHRDFSQMSREDRIRACYQHCALKYVLGQRMTNQSLRSRFGLGDSQTSACSGIIAAAKDASLVKLESSESTSLRYARYVPFWARVE